MNRIVTKVVEIDGGTLTAYSGNFEFYEQQRAQAETQQQAQFERQQAMLAKEIKFIERFKARASHAAQVQSRVKKLEKIDRVEPPRRRQAVFFEFPPAPRSGEDVASLKRVHKGYGSRSIYEGFDFQVRRRERWCVMGINGAGKSTLLKGIIGQLKPLSGSLSLDGLKRSDIAYLPQQIDIDRSFPITVFDAVAMGLWHDIGAWRGLDGERSLAVQEALHRLGLRDLGDRSVGALSGGQFQRVLFARLLLQDASIILLDEPFRAVDTKTVDDLLRLIGRWHAEGRTVVAALHDLDQVRAHFPKTLLIAREVVAWGPTRQVLTPKNLAKSRQLTEAWDEHAEVCERGEAARERISA